MSKLIYLTADMLVTEQRTVIIASASRVYIDCHSDVNLDGKFKENGSEFSGGCAKGLTKFTLKSYRSNRQNVYILTFRSFSFFLKFTAFEEKNQWIMMIMITLNVTNQIADRQNEAICNQCQRQLGWKVDRWVTVGKHGKEQASIASKDRILKRCHEKIKKFKDSGNTNRIIVFN